MNADALSDLVLMLVCASIAWRSRQTRPAVAIATTLIGAAALLGVLRYSGVSMLWGPHRFASLLAACAAFPLLAAGLRWSDGALATRHAAVGRFVVVWGGVGIALTVMGVTPLREAMPSELFLVLVFLATAIPLVTAAGVLLMVYIIFIGRARIAWGGAIIVLMALTVAPLRDVVPGISALLILWTVVQQRSVTGIVGALLLVGSFIVAATGKPDTQYLNVFNSTQALHYLLAAGLGLLTWPRPTNVIAAVA